MYMSRLSGKAVVGWDFPIVKTSGGRMRGVQKENGFIFRSVPYGKAERFEKSGFIKEEESLFLTDHYTCTCPELLTPVPERQYREPHFFLPQDEDCLTLNIWTPALESERNFPVLVWLGAGDWEKGGANELFASDGENLSSYGEMVIVAVNHRLNILGTMNLTAKADVDICYSQGLWDIVLALRWVQENIAAFGGNAENVTLFGDSGGSQKIWDIFHTPEADGLYHKAVISGAKMPESTKAESVRLLAELIIKRTGEDDLKTMPFWFLAEHVLDALEEYKKITGEKYEWGAVTKERQMSEIPMLLGTGGSESKQIRQLVQKEVREGRKMWYYNFSFSSRVYGAEKACNGAELPFWFRNADYLECSYVPGVTEKLQDEMAGSLAAFVHTGNPQMKGGEAWEMVRENVMTVRRFGGKI